MGKTTRADLVKYFLHDPASVAQSYVQWAGDMQSRSGITYGCVLDNVLLPLQPGKMMGIAGRPGMGKTSLMSFWLDREAKAIVTEGREKECCVFCGWDQQAEETETVFQDIRGYTVTDLAWGKADMDAVRANALPRVSLPIYHIGYSYRHNGQQRPPAPTLDDVYEIVQYIEFELGLHVSLIAFDYIQKVPLGRSGRSRVEEVTEAWYRTNELLSRIGAAGMVAIQASREADQRKLPIPEMSDMQWGSTGEQELDVLLSLLKPIRMFPVHEYPYINVKGVEYANDDRLLLIKVLKQRFAHGYGIYPVSLDMSTMTMTDFDLHTINLNGKGPKSKEPIPF